MQRATSIVAGLLIAACRAERPAGAPSRDVPAPAPGLRRDLVGCYAIQSVVAPPQFGRSPVVYLDSAPALGGPPGYWRLGAGADSALGGRRTMERWALDSRTDSVRLFLAYGLGGTSVVVAAPGPPPWKGHTSSQSDVAGEPPVHVGAVTMARVPCPTRRE